jgi:hypothetical protein
LNFTPYQYSFNNPISFKDDNGKEVRFFYERVSEKSLRAGVPDYPIVGSMIYYLYGPVHCYVQVETEKYNYIFELGGPQNGSLTGIPKMTILKPGEKPNRKGQGELEILRPKVEKYPNEFEDNIVATYKDVENRINDNGEPKYDARRTNSNGFANYLIQASGGGFPWRFWGLAPFPGIYNIQPYYPPKDKKEKNSKKESK